MADKIIRDPLYNYICIDKARDGWLIELLDCPEVQRLRRIHQLGVSNYTYPGADHNRLAHSLGVVYLMQQVLGHLERTSSEAKIETARMRLLAAALLHDVGHGPFSHLLEPCLGIQHEAWSIALVLDSTTQINRILGREDYTLPKQVADLIQETNPEPALWQKALLSSQLDVDRLDYLRRDSLFTGAGYGHFDWFRLLTSVGFHGDDMDLVWPEKSALAIEEYIFARFYMYQNVYLHKTTRGYEQVLQAMWNRANALRAEGKDVAAVPVLAELWSKPKPEPGTLSNQAYLNLEEFTVLSQIQAWKSHDDKVLADLARRFLVRGGFAMIDPPPPDEELTPDYQRWDQALHEIVARAGFGLPVMYCLRDKLDSKYLQPYRPEPEPANQTAINSIRIRKADGTLEEISACLPRLRAVTTPPGHKWRYYVPKEVRDEVEKLKREWRPAAGVDGVTA